MSTNMERFKEYIKRNPNLKNEVIAKKKTWQELYEEFILIGDDSKTAEPESPRTDSKSSDTTQMIKNVIGYVKKIDPDQITKTVTSIQKVIELLASFGAGASVASASKSTLDPLFDRKFDEWY